MERPNPSNDRAEPPVRAPWRWFDRATSPARRSLRFGAGLPFPGAFRHATGALERFHYGPPHQPWSSLRAGDHRDPRLIYVHGSPGDASIWVRFLSDPVNNWESCSIDRPGYGLSNYGPEPTLASQAAAIEPLLEQRQGAWPILVGHSLGGSIVAQVAATHPERISGLVIIAGALAPELERLRWYNHAAKRLSWVLPGNLVRSNQEMWNLKAELHTLSFQLHRVRCPVLIVHGHRDNLVPFENVAFMQRAFAGAPSVEVLHWPEANHFLIWKEPYRSELRERIEQLAGQAHPAS